MKTLGVIGGMGWESTALYYRVLNREVRRRLGEGYSARLIVDSLQFATLASARSPADFERVREMLVASGQRLEAAGAEVLVIACNTAHRFAHAVEQSVSVPLLHIADSVAAAVQTDGHACVGLLGTRATMTGSFYARRLIEHHGLQVLVPEKADALRVDTVIVDELVHGKASSESQAALRAVVERLAERGASAVLLACTELGLAFGGQDQAKRQLAVPAFDTAVVHAQAAVDFTLAR